MQSFIFTLEEHEARAMLLGYRYHKSLHVYIRGTSMKPDTLDPDTLKPLALGGRGYKVIKGELGCKASS